MLIHEFRRCNKLILKNKSILENLIDWFSKDVNAKVVDGTPKLFNVPALIIDDEADAAPPAGDDADEARARHARGTEHQRLE